ncbi:MAG: hypothetical protein AAF438_08955 [Pseudomonadota bacterium]
MKKLIPIFLLFTFSAHAQLEEIVVTASRASTELPGQRVTRKGDFLLLRVTISNDSREEEQREKEIHKTLLDAIKKAKGQRNIELSSVTPSDFVIPLTEANHRIELNDGARPDTSQAAFRVKSAISSDAKDGEGLVLNLRRFVNDLKMAGRTLVEIDNDVEISIVNPSQYRSQVIQLMAEDIKTVTSAIGDDYRVIVEGVDGPVEWARVGSLNVSIYVPYRYVVLPTSINSYNVWPEY